MDLTTTYLGLQLKSPLVPSAAAPLTENIDNLKRMEDAGAAAVVLHSVLKNNCFKKNTNFITISPTVRKVLPRL